jgi:Cu/Ag efflux protein CusF
LTDAFPRVSSTLPKNPLAKEISMRLVALLAASLIAVPAVAQQPAAEEAGAAATAPGKAAAVEIQTVSASVEAIDKENRLVVLKGPEGNLFAVAAGPEVRNFDQIKVGDQVVVRHYEALSLELKKGGSGIRERVETETAGRAAPGERPSAGVAREVKVVANVVGVDAKKQTVRLRGPKHTVDLKVRDPNQLKLVKVGDQVEATYIEATAISVEPGTKPAADK